MKKLIYTLALVLILNSAFNIQNSQAQWASYSTGIGTFNVKALLLNGSTVFAGTEGQSNGNGGGVYLTTNDGNLWTYSGLTPKNIGSLAVLGTNIFAGTYADGIFLSVNNGGSWSAASSGLGSGKVSALTVKGSNIFAGLTNSTGAGVYYSTNNGTSWSARGLLNTDVFALAVNSNKIFAATNFGIYYSTNDGANWVQTSVTTGNFLSLASSGTKVVAGGYNGVIYMSTNSGTNWALANTGIPVCDINSLAFVGNSIFAGSGSQSAYWGNYISTNTGASWSTKNEGLGWVPPVLAYMVTSTYIFAGTGAQVIRRNASEFIGIQNISTEIPSAYSLSQNYPNPFNPTTKIRFAIPNSVSSPHAVGGDLVLLKVFDINGREVATLVNESLAPGTYETTFDGSALSSGTYFYKLTIGAFTQTKKLTLLK